jgi:hypothetical protein
MKDLRLSPVRLLAEAYLLQAAICPCGGIGGAAAAGLAPRQSLMKDERASPVRPFAEAAVLQVDIVSCWEPAAAGECQRTADSASAEQVIRVDNFTGESSGECKVPRFDCGRKVEFPGVVETSGRTRKPSSVHIGPHQREFGIEIDNCGCCGGRLKIIASIEDPQVIATILSHLERTMPDQYQSELPLGARAPPVPSRLL